MRWRLLALPLTILPLACTPAEISGPPGPSGGDSDLVDASGAAELALADELQGTEITRETSGGWEIRRASGARETNASGPTASRVSKSRGVRRYAAEPGIAEGLEVSAPLSGSDDSSADGAVLAGSAPVDGWAGEASSSELGDVSLDSEDESFELARGGVVDELRDRLATGAPLRAGSSDDNADFEAYLEYLANASQNSHLGSRYAPIDVSGRRFVRVVDANGRPVPGAETIVLDEARDVVIGAARTYGDGRAPFYPTSEPGDAPVDDALANAAPASWLVQVRFGDAMQRVRFSGAEAEITVTLETVEFDASKPELDVLFLIDTTGSMGDEIARIKASLLGVTQRLRSLELEFGLRYGAVLYRDLSDEYVTKSHPFTDDIEAFDSALGAIVANGGGDTPESLNQGLAVAIDRADWRENAAKVVFLIADAPPHMDYEGDTPYSDSLRAAVAKGIRVHSVAASGLDDVGSLVFRQIAQYSRGKFIFIEYGSTAASAESHGVKGEVKSNNLDDIIYEQIRDEIAQWGRG